MNGSRRKGGKRKRWEDNIVDGIERCKDGVNIFNNKKMFQMTCLADIHERRLCCCTAFLEYVNAYFMNAFSKSLIREFRFILRV